MRGSVLAVALLASAWGCQFVPGAIRPRETGRAAPELPKGSLDLPEAVYYTDYGPAEIDVSSYPVAQRRNYQVFKQVCGDCHTLARAVNSPTQSRTYWRFHLARMSVHSRFQRGGPLSPEDREAVLDFLDHDAHARKEGDKAAFEARDAELKRRFDPILEQYLYEIQKREEPRAP